MRVTLIFQLWMSGGLVALATPGRSSDPCYDHQNVTYTARFNPTECNGVLCTATPFFSPETSVEAYIDIIESANISIDIFTPDFYSWGKCTSHVGECGGACIGCTLETQRGESFPVFTALLNAVHLRKVAVRLLINDYHVPTCQGLITPLDWLTLNGISVHLYTTTTFLHAKYMMADKGKRTLVSSVNFSQTSFTKNREAGVIIEDCNCSAIDFYQEVFESDWGQSYPYVVKNTYNESQLAYIQDTSVLPYAIPEYHKVAGAYVAPYISYSGVIFKLAYTAPDYAFETVMKAIQMVTSSLHVMIYQITHPAMCNATLHLFRSGKNVTLLVSPSILSRAEYRLAYCCYLELYNAGMKGSIRKSNTGFQFSHQKFWIIDGTSVHLSTGNWSPDDFPQNSTFPPYKKSHTSVFRDMLVVMESPQIIQAFQNVFNGDWAIGTDWHPKNSTTC